MPAPPSPRPQLPPAPPPGATAVRPTWTHLPAAVRVAVEDRLGGRVVAAASQGAGFTAAFASRLRLVDGRRAFVKAVSSAVNPEIHDSYRDEARIAAALPADVPAPRLQWSADIGDWLVLAFEDVDGRPPHRPWRRDELQRVLDVLPGLAAALTPQPPGLGLASIIDQDATFSLWRRVAASTAELSAPYETWRRHVAELADLEGGCVSAAAGETAVHFDLRDDNLLLTPDRVLICDWNWPLLAAPWVDLVCLLLGAYGDGYDADALLAAHPLGSPAARDDIDALLAGLAGFWVERAPRPLPTPSSPWLRVYQAWYAQVTLHWLAARRGWPTRS